MSNVKFAKPSARERTVDLDYPLLIDGEIVDKVVVTRMTVRQVNEFVEKLLAGETPPLPMLSIPEDVLDDLDDDDRQKIEGVVRDFLPARLRAAGEQAGVLEPSQPSPDGEGTSPSSPQS